MMDLAVVGGGPVGLAAAIHAALKGMSVQVFEPKRGVIDKACGEGIMPSGVRRMKQIGVDPHPRFPFRGIRYTDGQSNAAADFTTGPGWGIRRTVLHRALLERAEHLGVRHQHQRVIGLTSHHDHVVLRTAHRDHSARWVAAADGLRSPIRHALGLDEGVTRAPRVGLRRHYRIAPWSPVVEVHWGPTAEAYVTPEDAHLVGIAFLFGQDARRAHPPDGRPLFDRLMDGFPQLKERLTEPCTDVRGGGPFEVNATAHVRDRVFLVGDASGFVDPLTGEGITLGLGCAEAAVNAMITNQPAAYEAQWWKLTRNYRWLTTGLLTLAQTSWTRSLIVAGAQRIPGAMGFAVRRIGD